MDSQEQTLQNIQYAMILWDYLFKHRELDINNNKNNYLSEAIREFNAQSYSDVLSVREILESMAQSINYRLVIDDLLILMPEIETTNSLTAKQFLKQFHWKKKGQEGYEAQDEEFNTLHQIASLILWGMLLVSSGGSLQIQSVTISEWESAIQKKLEDLAGKANEPEARQKFQKLLVFWDSLKRIDKKNSTSNRIVMLNRIANRLQDGDLVTFDSADNVITATKYFEVFSSQMVDSTDTGLQQKIDDYLGEYYSYE